jgi:hypothetical protein
MSNKNKKSKNSTKVPLKESNNDILKLYETSDNDDLYLQLGIKLNLDTVPMTAIDPETGMIALTGIQINKEATLEQRLKIVNTIIQELQDQILLVSIGKIDKARFEVLTEMYGIEEQDITI